MTLGDFIEHVQTARTVALKLDGSAVHLRIKGPLDFSSLSIISPFSQDPRPSVEIVRLEHSMAVRTSSRFKFGTGFVS